MSAGSSAWKGGMIAVRAVTVAGLALSLAACSQSTGLIGELSGPVEPQPQVAEGAASTRSELEKATEYWGKEHAKMPRDGKAAINYARNLRAMDRKAEALAALQSSYLYNAQDREYLSEFGRLALEQDQAPLAQQLLERADDPAKPDWRILSARGAALAKQGQFKAAIPFFERARTLAPAQASVMSNLALAYAMDGQADKAEPLLRQATASEANDPRVRQNLALVLRLQGKAEEATRVAMGADQPTLVPAPSISVASSQPLQPVPVFATETRPSASPITQVSASPITQVSASPITQVSASPITQVSASPTTQVSARPAAAKVAADAAKDAAHAGWITTSSVPQR